MNSRTVEKVINGQATSDGAGVELTRMIGQPQLMDLDPFLLLDAFRSDNPDDYIAGFPAHPHRGFETVTYLLNGRMRHRDNAGNEGVIEPGGIQWMTAGRGIVHSEMPEQQDGMLSGFQLWINLPAEHKMTAPNYQEHDSTEIPVETRNTTQIRVISGKTSAGTIGPVSQPLTDPLYLDVSLAPGAEFEEPLAAQHNAFIQVIDGVITLQKNDQSRIDLQRDQLAVLSKGDSVVVRGGDQNSRFLLVAGKPLNEPIARGGPFVMNTEAELRQAFSDYQRGEF
jgi:redox-sensitive bicupin YhaK (pirin superfamily)